MGRAVGWVPYVLFGLALATIIYALLTGGARLSLLVVLPVLTGNSLWFLLGVAFLILGFLSLPFAWAADAADDASVNDSPPAGAGSGGVLLVGPVPLFFGSFRGLPTRIKWAWVALGIAVTAALVAATILLGT